MPIQALADDTELDPVEQPSAPAKPKIVPLAPDAQLDARRDKLASEYSHIAPSGQMSPTVEKIDTKSGVKNDSFLLDWNLAETPQEEELALRKHYGPPEQGKWG